MTSTLRSLTAAAAAALLLTLAACSSPATTTAEPSSSAAAPAAEGECAGVTIVVDASALEGDDDVSLEECVETDEAVAAADALAEAGVETEGTVEYGDQVVCRVNGAPAADTVLAADDGTEYSETCESMAPAFAYWSLWVKTAESEWDYAQEGLSTLQVEPGDSVALLFTLNGEPAAPTT
ncbi:hypothetical protein ASD56_01150 [Microbacterium sp. Root166]|uniref:hypothetical protein n=1 Tax=Microbacterium sp. Root166 TaxID=1736478 RepID=UPI0006F48967|nr:hypothetical protein [Microbacterium sp. Root166]KQZ85011.1 hypothetical protein ASD56_01150 [Microbacterium sp. Root166]